MVRKISLIGAILNSVATFLFVSLLMHPDISDTPDKYSYLSMDNLEDAPYPILVIIFSVGLLLTFVDSLRTDKKMLKVGGIISLIGAIMVNVCFQNGIVDGDPDQNLNDMAVFSGMYNLSLIILLVGLVFYLVGCIHYRFNYKPGIIFGPLLLVIVLASLILSFLVVGSLTSYSFDPLSNPNSYPEIMDIHIIMYLFWMVLITLNGWLFAFMAKSGNVGKDADDEELSVSGGGAFQSYVDKSAYQGYKPPEKVSDDVVFEF